MWRVDRWERGEPGRWVVLLPSVTEEEARRRLLAARGHTIMQAIRLVPETGQWHRMWTTGDGSFARLRSL